MNSLPKNDLSRDIKDQTKPQVVPKKFIFNVAQNQPQTDEPHEFIKLARNLKLQKYVPVIHEFDEPDDFQEAYEGVCEYIMAAYSELRELIMSVNLSPL